MIYICVPSHNNAATVGLLLWKVRQVLAAFPREFQLLVADDGSTDSTEEVLSSYGPVLPMSVTKYRTARGYAATVEALLRQALRLTDHPKRDSAIVLNADFSVSPSVLPDLIRGIESGADVVVGEATQRPQSFGRRLVQLSSTWLLKPGLTMPGVQDLLSGVCAIRLVTLKRCLREREGEHGGGSALLETDGVCARAELVARASTCARQITVLSFAPSSLRNGTVHDRPMSLAMQLYRAGKSLHIPQPEAPVRRAS
ncbi:MAG: glycosyltransferase [Gemmatimonadetes bacterium]|nr:glycosyltransferase [Gemmatimonadota bacterium]